MARVLMAALIAIAIGQPGVATAARTLLADLMARPLAQPGTKPMSALALEACLRRALELDRDGTAIDYEIAAIDREAAEALLLQKQINAELPVLGDFDEPALNAFQRARDPSRRADEKIPRRVPALRAANKRAYDAAVPNLNAIARGRFTADDLDAVQSRNSTCTSIAATLTQVIALVCPCAPDAARVIFAAGADDGRWTTGSPQGACASLVRALRNDICAAFEAVEDALPADAPFRSQAPAVSCARRGSAPTITARRAAAA